MVSLRLLVCTLILSAYSLVHLQLQWLLSVALEPDITSLIWYRQAQDDQSLRIHIQPEINRISSIN